MIFSKKKPSLFGMELKLNPEVRKHVMRDGLAESYGVDGEFLNHVEDGKWKQMPYSKLLFLVAKAEEIGKSPFILETSEMWSTFRHSHTTRVLIGEDLNRKPVPDDMACAQRFLDAFGTKINLNRLDADKIRELMATENVIAIGGSKVNTATMVALEIMSAAAKQPIRFLWPDYQPKSPVEGTSSDGNRHLEVGTRKFHEGDSPRGPRYGLMAVCRKPMGGKRDVTTVVMAGCSKSATAAMGEAIEDPLFSRQYDASWKGKADGHPVFFLFEERNNTSKWSILSGPEKVRRRGGRPRKE